MNLKRPTGCILRIPEPDFTPSENPRFSELFQSNGLFGLKFGVHVVVWRVESVGLANATPVTTVLRKSAVEREIMKKSKQKE